MPYWREGIVIILMNKIDIYIIKGVVSWFLVSQICVSFLFLATQAFRLIAVFKGIDWSFSALGALLWIQVPIWGWALGPSFLLAIFVQAHTMAQQGELVALDSMGVGRRRAMRGPLTVAVGVAILSGWLWTLAAPASQWHLRQYLRNAVATSVVNNLAVEEFIQPVPNMIFYAQNKQSHGRYDSIFVQRAMGKQTQVLVASKANVALSPSASAMDIEFRNGELFHWGDARGVLRFEQLDVSIPIVQGIHQQLQSFPDAMSVSTKHLFHAVTLGTASLFAEFEFFRRVAKPLEFLVLALLGCVWVFAVTWKRRIAALGGAIGLFLGMYLTARAAEAWLLNTNGSAIIAAFFPSIVAWSLLMGSVGRKLFKNRCNSL